MALGGRAAEKVVSGEMTTGAESVIQNLTQIARGMVGRWGTSEAIGPLAIDGRQDGCCCPAPSRSPHAPSRWWTRRRDTSSSRITEAMDRDKRPQRRTTLKLTLRVFEGRGSFRPPGLAG